MVAFLLGGIPVSRLLVLLAGVVFFGFAVFLRSEVDKWAKAVRESGASAD